MNLFEKFYDRTTSRKRKHLDYVSDEIMHLRYSIINLSLAYARKEITENTYHRRVSNKALLLAKYERYSRQLRRWI